ncbi:hypothetical protein ACFWB1_35700 [Streptomyces goshikiensis]|uniref:hypothetical protein n=1 Tax=Streptomyces goshikiensis TaxID=1942 RepID=UPI0036BDAE18
MTESGQGSGQHRAPQSGVPQGGEPWGQPGYGYPQPEPEPGHVVGPGFEGPGEPHGYGYPPLPEAVTQYIPPVPPGPGPGQHEAATQYIPPVPSGPGPGQHEAATQYIPPVPSGPGPGSGQHDAATQYIPPVPSGPGQHEAATQYIPPVPSGPGPGSGQHEAATQFIPPVPSGPGPVSGQHEAATQFIPPVPSGPGPGPGQHEAATQFIPPVPSGPGPGSGQHDAATQYIPPVPPGPAPNAAEGFDGLFRNDAAAGQTQHLPPVQAPVRRQQPPPRAYPQPQQQAHPHPHPQPAAQQYAPPPAEPGRRVSPLIIGAVVVGLAVVGLGVGALLSDDKPQNTDPGAAPAAPTGSGSAAAGGEAPVDPARPQAVQLDKLLADSNDSRASVIKAVEDIKGCRNLGQAGDDLRDAARQREELVTRLQELKLDKLPDHAKLSAALTKAWKSSADADNSYAAWADDVGDGKKNCKDGQAKATPHAVDGNKSSGEATRAKDSAAAMWNSIAAKYGLTKRDKSQL